MPFTPTPQSLANDSLIQTGFGTYGKPMSMAEAAQMQLEQQKAQQAQQLRENWPAIMEQLKGKQPQEVISILAPFVGLDQATKTAQEYRLANQPVNLPQGYQINQATGKAELIPGIDPSFGRKGTTLNELGVFGAGADAPADAPVNLDAPQITGEDYLKSLKPSEQRLVKSVSEGHQILPQRVLATTRGQQIMDAVLKYDPTYDFADPTTRVKTRVDFTTGKSAQNITALNTAIAHLDKLSKDYDSLNNGSIPAINSMQNYLGKQIGMADIQKNTANVETDAEAVSHELAKVFRSTGMSEAEIRAWKENISTNAAPPTSKAVVQSALELMNGRLEALGQQYNQGMGKVVDPIQLLSPKAQEAFNRLSGSELGNPEIPAKNKIGSIIEAGGKKYRVTGPGDGSDDPDVELVK